MTKQYYKDSSFEIYFGKMENILKTFDKNSIDCIITDPPYEINFMNKEWDKSGVAFKKETWEYCFNVLKPGGYLLAFGGSRTYHRITCAIEDAGFEIRDCILWVYGSGFPKSLNLFKLMKRKGKEMEKWQGYGTCLKPAYEPIILARKPFKGSLVDNLLKNNVGGLNIEECRIPLNNETIAKNIAFTEVKQSSGWGTKQCITEQTEDGRFPANVITDGSEEVTKLFPMRNTPNGSITKQYTMNHIVYGNYGQCNIYQSKKDKGSAIRYFKQCKYSDKDLNYPPLYYCSKASKRDRNEGTIKNIHPTIKPTELMQYLIRLVAPKGTIILDPFMGSGSTGKACMLENIEHDSNYYFIGIEMTDDYLPIARDRILYAKNKYQYQIKDSNGVQTLFDFMEDQ